MNDAQSKIAALTQLADLAARICRELKETTFDSLHFAALGLAEVSIDASCLFLIQEIKSRIPPNQTTKEPN